jgi:hypothetical protein
VQRFVGEHTGYQRLEDPVIHRREIKLDTRQQHLEVTDTLRCEGAHVACRSWHFAEDCHVERTPNGLRVTSGLTAVQFEALEELYEVQVHRAGTAEQGGWISRRFGLKVPCTTVHWYSRVSGQTVLRTRIMYTRSRGLGL